MLNQTEIDLLAVYFENSVDLAISPFFAQDSMNLGHTGGGEDFLEVRLADHNILKSTLLTYRKLWMVKEPTQYKKIHNILYKNVKSSALRGLLAGMYGPIKIALTQWFPSPPDGYGITPDRLIGLKLNCEYAHVGINPDATNSRTKLHDLEKRLGPGRVEYLFEEAVMSSGSELFQHGLMMPAAMHYFSQRGSPKPSIRMSARAADYLGVSTARGNVVRESPGYTPGPETRASALRRVLNRYRYHALQDLIITVMGEGEVDFEDLFRCISLEHMLCSRGINYICKNVYPSVSEQEEMRFKCYRSVNDPDEYCFDKGAYLVNEDESIEFYGKALQILNKLFSGANEQSKIGPVREREKLVHDLVRHWYTQWV